MKKIYTTVLTLALLAVYSSLTSQVVINEYGCANKSDHQDATGNYEDWVEIYNAGASAVNISGWHLSDQKGQPLKWTIPAGTSLAVGARRMFYCSSRDGVISGQFHTNFKMTQSSGSEELCLTDVGGNFIDSLTLKKARRNHSRGRTTDGAATWSVFEDPTPNASNATTTVTAKPEYVPMPVFSIQPGFYSGTQSLTITCSQANTSIYYTTNGAIPTNTVSGTNLLYSGPISISTTRAIRVRAFDNNNVYAGSFTVTGTFFINEPVNTYPVWSIVSNQMTSGGFFSSGNETMISIEYFGSHNGQRIFQQEGDVKRHGNDSWQYDQQGMRIYARDDYGYANKFDHQIFPTTVRDEFDVIILKAAGSDNFPDGGSSPPSRCAHVRDSYVQTLAEKFNLNVDVRRFKNAITYVNGAYWGVYESRERIDVDYTEYYYDNGEKWVDMLEYWGGMQIVAGSDTAWNNLFNYVVANNLTVNANYNYVISKLDPMSMIDYFILNTYTVNSDWLNWNTAWWRGRKPGQQVRWRYKLWDQDNTFNLGQNYTGLPTTNNTADPCDIETTSYATTNDPHEGHVRIFNKLMTNPQFEQMYINRYADLINTAFYCPNMLTHFDTMIARLAPEMTRQTAKWGSNVGQWNTAVTYTRNQIAGRCNNVIVGMGPCYNVTGPYPVKVNVSPSCAGTIKVNSTTPDQYPWTGNYYGGINVSFEANPATGWQFSHWQLTHTPNPSTTADSIWFDLGSTGDSVVAVFTQVSATPGQLTVFLQGNNPGLVTVNGTPVTNGQVVPVNYGSSVTVSATPISGCTFNRWDLSHSLLYPTDTFETVTFCFRQNDTLFAYFDVCNIVPDSLTVLVQQPGFGSVTINGIPVPAPVTVPMNAGTLLSAVATPTAGYTFSHWLLAHHTLTPNSTTAAASFTFNQRDTLIAVFLPPDTFNLTVMVNPLPGGNVSVNGTTPPAYPTVLKIVDGTVVNVVATANVGYTFANWVLLHHTLAPNTTTANASFTITQNDTILANFTLNPIPPDTFDLTVMVNPLPGGNVSVNGTTPPAYPTVLKIVDGTVVNVVATANVGYTFTNWVLLHHTLAPNATTANANFTITQNDTILANFTVNPIPPDTFDLTVMVNPLPGGNVSVNGTTPPAYPTVLKIVDGTVVNVIATANIGYTFTNWVLLHHTLAPNATTANANFTITQNDTILANFVVNPNPPDTFDLTVMVNPLPGGNVSVNGTTPPVYPTVLKIVDGTVVNVIATANIGYTFTNWVLLHHTLAPNATTANANFTITQNDTILANFVVNPNPPDTFDLTVMVNPLPGGNVSVNGTTPPAYPTVLKIVDGTVVNVAATANGGYTFTNWVLLHHTLAPNATTTNANFTITQNDTILANFTLNPIPGDTFDVVLQAFPAQGGSVTVNGTTYSTYPTVLKVPDGTLLNVTANANIGYAFMQWHVVYQSALPTDSANPMQFTCTGPDTIYAFFIDLIDSFNLTVNNTPVGGGTVTINGTAVSVYPTTFKFEGNTPITASVISNTGFTFTDWTIDNHTLAPNDTALSVNFALTANDTLTANYYVWPDTLSIVVDVRPNSLAGEVKVGGFTPPGYPWNIPVIKGVNLDFEAMGKTITTQNQTYNYVFDRYEFIYHNPIPNPNEPIVFIQPQVPDTVIAYFVNEPVNTDTLVYVLIPSGFSPDGDGVNDVFHVVGEQLAQGNLQVFNRWGQKVFESNNPNQYGWNGEHNGKKCDMGVYAYTLIAKRLNGDEVKMKGTITLVR